MIRKQSHLLALLLFLSSLSNSSFLSERQQDYCQGVNLSNGNYTQSELDYYRNSRSNIHRRYYRQAFEYYVTGNSSTYIKAMEWPIALLLTLLCLIVVAAVFFAVSILKFRKSYRNKTLFNALLIIGTVIAAVLVALFVTIIVFIGLATVAQKKSKCQYLNVENFLLDGYNNSQTGDNYIGLNKFVLALANFSVESANITNAFSDAQRIANLNLRGLALSAITSLEALVTTYKNTLTSNPFGVETQPFSAQNMTFYISDQAEKEFKELVYVSTHVDAAARAASDLILFPNATTRSLLIGELISNINATQNDIQTLGEQIWDRGLERLRYVSAGYWTIFAISILLLLLTLSVIIGGIWTYSKNYYGKVTKVAKIIFFCIVFLILVYGICVIILMAGVVAVSTFCEVLASVNQGNIAVLNELRTPFPGTSLEILRECISGQGDISRFYQPQGNQTLQEDGFRVSDFISGILVGVVYDRHGNKSATSQAIRDQVEAYQQILQGKVEDHAGVFAQLNTINNLVNCSNQRIALTNYTCNTQPGQECISIIDTPSYQTPNCSQSPSLANAIFTNLRSYIQSEANYLGGLIANLNGRQAYTPQSTYEYAKVSLNSILPNVQNIASAVPRTMSALSAYNLTDIRSTQCTSIKKELLILEDHACFNLNYYAYVLLVISSVSFVLLFALLWIFWLLTKEIEAPNTNLVASKMGMSAIDKRLKNLNDRETLPDL